MRQTLPILHVPDRGSNPLEPRMTSKKPHRWRRATGIGRDGVPFQRWLVPGRRSPSQETAHPSQDPLPALPRGESTIGISSHSNSAIAPGSASLQGSGWPNGSQTPGAFAGLPSLPARVQRFRKVHRWVQRRNVSRCTLDQQRCTSAQARETRRSHGQGFHDLISKVHRWVQRSLRVRPHLWRVQPLIQGKARG